MSMKPVLSALQFLPLLIAGIGSIGCAIKRETRPAPTSAKDRDASLPTEEIMADLLYSMTLGEKVAQLAQSATYPASAKPRNSFKEDRNIDYPIACAIMRPLRRGLRGSDTDVYDQPDVGDFRGKSPAAYPKIVRAVRPLFLSVYKRQDVQ